MNDSVHPVISLFQLRNSISNTLSNEEDPTVRSIFQIIPPLEKNQINKMANIIKRKKKLSIALKELSIGLVFHPTIVPNLRAFIYQENISSEFIFIACAYSCIAWNKDKNVKRSAEDFHTLIDVLSHFSIRQNQYYSITNYAFAKLISAASGVKGIKWTIESMRAVLAHLHLNPSIPSTFFPKILEFWDSVHQSIPDISVEVLANLTTLIEQEQNCIDWNKIPLLILKTNALANRLERRALLLNAKISEKAYISTLIDTYKLFPSNMYEMLKETPEIKKPLVKQSVEQIPDILINQLPFTINKCDTFLNGFRLLPLDIIENEIPFQQMFEKDFYTSISSLSDCIAYSGKKYQEAFFQSFSEYIKTMSTSSRFLEISACTVIILSKVIQSNRTFEFFPLIFQTEVFEPSFNIYTEIDPWINTMRNQIFGLIMRYSPFDIYSIFKEAANYPLLFTEHLLRITIFTKDLSFLLTETTIFMIIQSTLKLQNMDYRARSDNFVFLVELTMKHQCYSFPLFVNGYLWFIFETYLTEYIIKGILSTIAELPSTFNSTPLVSFICKAFNACRINKYAQLGEQLAYSLYMGLVHNPKIYPLFQPVLKSILDFIEACPSSNILDIALSILSIHLESQKHMILSGFYLERFINVITLVDGEIPSQLTNTRLFDLITASHNIQKQNEFLIKNPSIIPLVLAVFGNTKYLIDKINKFYKLAKLSRFNTRACVNGDLDYMLLLFVMQNKEVATITYKCIEITMKCSIEDSRNILIPFICDMAVIKSSNAIAYKFQQAIFRDTMFSKAVLSILERIIAVPHPLFQIGTIPAPFTVNKLKAEDFTNLFSFTMEVNLDSSTSIGTNATVHLFSMTENEKSIRVFVNHNTIYCSYHGIGEPKIAYLLRSYPSNEWFKLDIVFDAHLNGVLQIAPYLNNEPFNHCEMQFKPFETNFIDMSIGGYEKSDEWINIETGLISHFKLYYGNFRIFKSNPRLIFDSDSIKTISQKRIFSMSKGEQTLETEGHVVEDHPLLFYVLKSNFANSLSNYFKYKTNTSIEGTRYILDILHYIFSNSIEAQMNFQKVRIICLHLMKKIEKIDANLFFITVKILSVIQHKPLAQTWFEEIAFNLWLWSRADFDDFYTILDYISRVFLHQYSEFFQRKSYVSRLLNQLCLMFFSKTENDSRLAHQFEHILSRAITFKYEIYDIDLIFTHLLSTNNQEEMLALLNILQIVEPSELQKAKHLRDVLIYLHECVKINNIDIVKHSIFLIHKMAMTNIMVHTFKVANDIVFSDFLMEVFNFVNEKAFAYPYLSSLQCILALYISDTEIDLASMTLLSISMAKRIKPVPEYYEHWFIFPLIIFYYIQESKQNGMCLYLLNMISKSPRLMEDLDNILILTEILQAADIFHKIDFITIFEPAIMREHPSNLIANKILMHLVCSCFFHYGKSKFFHQTLLDEFNISPFNQTKYKLPPQQYIKFSNCFSFFKTDFSKFNVFYDVRVDKRGRWKDENKFELAKRLLAETTDVDPRIVTILNGDYFNKGHMDKEVFYAIDSLFYDYTNHFIPILKRIINKTCEYMKEAQENPHMDTIFYEHKSEKELINEKKQIKESLVLNKAFKPEYKRSKANCSFYCPMIMKYTNKDEAQQIMPQKLQPLYNNQCKQIKFDSVQVKQFILYNNCFYLNNKCVKTKEISAIFARKGQNGESAIEIYTVNGYSYLIDFISLDNIMSIRLFNQVKIHKNIIMQKTTSKDFFDDSGFTNKWVTGLMSNFQYIMNLNIYSGRSFNSKLIYPVFPAILVKYDSLSEVCDLRLNANLNHILPNETNLSSAIIGPKSIAADHYFFPNIVGNDQLPKWANNKHEFIYKLRKALESNYVSSMLNIWIDKIFGTKKFLHRQLIYGNHPKRVVFKQQFEYVTYSVKNRIIAAVPIDKDKDLVLKFGLVLADGTVTYLRVLNEITQCIVGKIDHTNISAISGNNGKLAIVCADYHELTIVSKKIKTQPFTTGTDFFIYYTNSIIFCPDTTTVIVSSLDWSIQAVWRMNSRIIALAASQTFQRIAVATLDGSILVGSMRNGQEVNCQKIDEEVISILITQIWGFVLVRTRTKIVVLSVDGELINISHIETPIKNWFCCNSPNDFDYIICEGEKNTISIFEAFYPDKMMHVTDLETSMVSAHYDLLSRRFVFILQNGEIVLLPHKF